jgi:hypothetical protein
MLNEPRFDKALKVLLKSSRTVLYNVMIAMKGGIAIHLEAHPYEANIIIPKNNMLVHTNHFVETDF